MRIRGRQVQAKPPRIGQLASKLNGRQQRTAVRGYGQELLARPAGTDWDLPHGPDYSRHWHIRDKFEEANIDLSSSNADALCAKKYAEACLHITQGYRLHDYMTWSVDMLQEYSAKLQYFIQRAVERGYGPQTLVHRCLHINDWVDSDDESSSEDEDECDLDQVTLYQIGEIVRFMNVCVENNWTLVPHWD